jgi:hypothetical protein
MKIREYNGEKYVLKENKEDGHCVGCIFYKPNNSLITNISKCELRERGNFYSMKLCADLNSIDYIVVGTYLKYILKNL